VKRGRAPKRCATCSRAAQAGAAMTGLGFEPSLLGDREGSISLVSMSEAALPQPLTRTCLCSCALAKFRM